MPQPSSRQVLSLDSGWKFHVGDIPSPVPTDKHIAAYMANKAGWARGAAKSDYDDSDWRTVDLPHDWSVEGPFDPGNYIDNGFLPRGIGWYRRHFLLDPIDRGRYLAIQFDGISSHCTVYLNGHVVHRHFCGYTPCTIDISDVARYGTDVNTLAVRVDAVPIEGWWYEGAGIYRHVWLIKTAAVHVATFGTFVNPVRRSDSDWDTQIETTLENTSHKPVSCRLVSALGESSAGEDVTVPARSSVVVHQTIPITQPRLWSLESPHLYRMYTRLLVGDETIDACATPFGYRTIRFDPDHGFFLNDQPIKLKGTCNHQDHAGLGVALPDSIHEFRIRRLLDMGSNAYRAAHNPPAPELLDACDRLGMLVMDENRTFGSSPEHLAQLRSMVLRDRNHPSVILWSLCNEEAIQGTPVAANIARAMMHEVKRLDPSRPVTAAVSGGLLNDDCIADVVEVMSLNYQLPLLDAYHAKHPSVPLLSGETTCAITIRGKDETSLAPWGADAAQSWSHIAERPFVAGLFVWSGFDYRGEPTPHGWPYVCSQFGQLDLCGFAKRGFAQHQQFFGVTASPDSVDSNEPAVALGLEIHPTMGDAAKNIPADGRFALPITVFAIAADGTRTAGANNFVTFTVEGPARIIGVGNGDPACHEPDHATNRSLFGGLAQAIVQTTTIAGAITLVASAPGLKDATLILQSIPAPAPPAALPAQRRTLVTDWRMSAITADAPDVHQTLIEQDVNSWDRIDPGRAQAAWQSRTGYAIYRAQLTLPKAIQARGGELIFHAIAGTAEIHLSGARVARKEKPDPATVTIALPPATPSATLSLLLHATAAPAGLVGEVELIAR